MRRLCASPLRIAGVLALVASLSGSAFAQGSERSLAYPPGVAEARLIREMSEEIGVDEETLEKVEKLVVEIRAKDEELKGKVIEARNEVMALLDIGRPDEKKLMAAVGAAAGVARQTRELQVNGSVRIRALLTEDQLEKFMEVRTKAMERRRERAAKRRGRRPIPKGPADG